MKRISNRQCSVEFCRRRSFIGNATGRPPPRTNSRIRPWAQFRNREQRTCGCPRAGLGAVLRPALRRGQDALSASSAACGGTAATAAASAAKTSHRRRAKLRQIPHKTPQYFIGNRLSILTRHDRRNPAPRMYMVCENCWQM